MELAEFEVLENQIQNALDALRHADAELENLANVLPSERDRDLIRTVQKGNQINAVVIQFTRDQIQDLHTFAEEATKESGKE